MLVFTAANVVIFFDIKKGIRGNSYKQKARILSLTQVTPKFSSLRQHSRHPRGSSFHDGFPNAFHGNRIWYN